MIHSLIVLAACPTGETPEWTESPSGKCYRVPTWSSATQMECKRICGEGAGPACVTDAAESSWLENWTKADDGLVSTGVVTGRDGYYLWTGHYQETTTGAIDAGWTGCTDGTTGAIEIPWGTHPGSWNQGLPSAVQPHEDDYAPWGDTHKGPQDCAMLTSSGWIDNICVISYYCLCELGRGDNSAAYITWWAEHRDAWLASYRNNLYTCLGIDAAVGLAPALIVLAVWAIRGRRELDWKQRVKSRVSFVMVNVGWFLVVFGIMPLLLLYLSMGWVSEAGGIALWYACTIPVGLACLLLAIVPDDKCTLCWATPLLLVFFLLFTLLGLLTLLFFIGWYTILITLLGLGSLIAVAVSMCTLAKHPRLKYYRLWLIVRVFGLLLGLVLVALAIIDAGYFPEQASAYAVNATSCLVITAIMHPPVRRRICIWLAGVGRSMQAKAEAQLAAEAIWVTLATEKLAPTETEMKSTTASAGTAA